MKGIIFLILLAVLLFALSPVWMPWVMKRLTEREGLFYGKYERHGFDQFELHDVTFTNGAFSFRAKTVRSLTPLAIGEKILRREAITQAEYAISDWDLKVFDSRNGGSKAALYAKIEQIQKLARTARKFVSRAGLTNGVILAGGKSFRVSHLTWSNAIISGVIISTDFKQSLTVEVNNQALTETGLKARLEPFGADLRIQVSRSEELAAINGWVTWQTNLMTLRSAFRPSMKLPDWAGLDATNLVIAAEVFNLKDYENFKGNLTASWTNQAFEVAGDVHSEPLPGSVTGFPATLHLRASGNTNDIRVNLLDLISPSLSVRLFNPVSINYSRKMLSNEAKLGFVLDGGKQQALPMGGMLEGSLVVQPSQGKFPLANLHLTGSNISYRDIVATNLSLDSKLRWPLIEVTDFTLAMGNNSRLKLSARANLESRNVEGGEVVAEGPFLNSFLPDAVFYRGLELKGNFSGPMTNLHSEGQLAIQGLYAGPSRELGVKGKWSGTLASMENMEMEVEAEKSIARVQAKGRFSASVMEAELSRFEIIKDQKPVWLMEGVAGVRMEKFNKEISLTHFNLTGLDRFLRGEGKVRYPEQGTMTLVARNLDPQVLNDFLETIPAGLKVDQMELAVNWSNSPVAFTLSSDASYQTVSNLTFSATVRARGDAEGIKLQTLSVRGNSNEILSGSGFLPAFLDLASTNVVHFKDGPLSLELFTSTNTAFWAEMKPFLHASLENPQADFRLGGSWASPSGELRFSARKIDPQIPTNVVEKLPALENLQGVIQVSPTNIHLTKMTLSVEGQPLEADLTVPVAEKGNRLQERLRTDQASGNLRIRDARVGAFARLIPQFLSPQGLMDVSLQLTPGTNVSGYIYMRGVSTRPIVPLGAVQDIHGSLQFTNQSVKFENLAASIGGASVQLSGQTDLTTMDPRTHIPFFNLTIFGTNLPLARQTELVLRSDVDLLIEKTNASPPQIHGELRLRDSIFLSDIKNLVPGKTASVQKRPPYFSIDQKELADWKLNVRIAGDQFMKIRSPFFRGVASANLNMSGTLKDPVALGEVRLNSGTIQFPFSSLEVSQGLISITSDDPFRPHLLVNAGSRSFGYDVKMEVTGNSEAPVVQFSSNPGLGSDQIVLMLTAGEVPKNEISFSNQQKASRFGMFLGKSLFSKLTGSPGGSDRLIIRSGENVTESGGETYYVEYKLSEDWSIVGEYDRFNALNAGFKWRFLSR